MKCIHVERNKYKADKLKMNWGNYKIVINVDINILNNLGINGKISLSCDKCKGKTGLETKLTKIISREHF